MAVSLELPCLCLVTNSSVVTPDELVPRVAAAVAGGVNLVQVRDKELPGGRLLSLVEELKQAVHGRALIVVNERVDVAAAARVDGVQLGEEALAPSFARSIMPAGSLVGRSVHSASGARAAQAAGADFLVVGTMFATGSHPGASPAGPGLVHEVQGLCDVPLVGIGGITRDNLAEVVAAGASGIAVIRSILEAMDPGLAAEELRLALREAWQSLPAAGGPAAARQA